MIQIVQFNLFAAHEGRMKLCANRLVLTENASLAGVWSELGNEHPQTAALRAVRARRPEQSPAEASIPSGEEVRILHRIYRFNRADLQRRGFERQVRALSRILDYAEEFLHGFRSKYLQ